MRSQLRFLPLALFGVLAACSSAQAPDVDTLSSADVTDVDAITRRPDGTFDVQCHDGRLLHGLTASDVKSSGLCAAPHASDAFDPASCTGAPVTAAQILSMLDPPRGVIEKKVGRFQLLRRERSCYAGFPCSAWRAGTRDVTAPFSTVGETFTTNTTIPDQRFRLATAGDVVASFSANAVRVRLAGDAVTSSWGGANTPDSVTQAITASFDPTPASIGTQPIVSYTWMPTRGCPNGHCEGNDHIPGTATASWAGHPLSVTGVATASCVRLAAAASEPSKDAQGNDYTLESELVFLGDYAASACVAKTCFDQGAACGTVSDGCGGTLTCGACANGQACDAQGGNHCRAMTAAEQCASEGRVFCPGNGGCWDACF